MHWRKRVGMMVVLVIGLRLPIMLQANVALDWSGVMMAAIRLENTAPTLSARNLAILHLAIYDAVNSVTRTHQPYHFQIAPGAEASVEAAAAAAGHHILVSLYPGLRARADETFGLWRSTSGDSQAVTNGLDLGWTIATLMLGLRASDGSATDIPYIPSDLPGQWRRTPPFYRPPLTPQWRYVVPFAVDRIDPFVPAPPPALGSPEYAQALLQVQDLGGINSLTRTPEQTQIARFWSDFSYTAMPPGHWHEIAAGIARDRGTGLEDTARLMALVSLAEADAAIVCWEAKYRYNLWRPVTAVRRADEDGNATTTIDPLWDSLLPAPPFPAYTSGHSTFSAAAARVIARFYGTDKITFTAASDALPGVFRSFQSLSACVEEIGMSRIYGGIHFPFDNEAGKQSGRLVGNYVSAHYLLPETQLPDVRVEHATPATIGLVVHGRIGRGFVLEASADFGGWTGIATNQAVPGGVRFALPNGPEPHRFYRVHELPP